MKVLVTFARWFTTDVEATLPGLRALVGRDVDFRFQFTDDIEIISIGDFCLVAGAASAALQPYRDTIGPVVVEDLDDAKETLVNSGVLISRDEETSVTGRFFYGRHQDGTEVEYLQWKPEILALYQRGGSAS